MQFSATYRINISTSEEMMLISFYVHMRAAIGICINIHILPFQWNQRTNEMRKLMLSKGCNTISSRTVQFRYMHRSSSCSVYTIYLLYVPLIYKHREDREKNIFIHKNYLNVYWHVWYLYLFLDFMLGRQSIFIFIIIYYYFFFLSECGVGCYLASTTTTHKLDVLS